MGATVPNMQQIKVNHAENIVAIRTVFPVDSPNAWGCMTSDRGGHYMSDDDANQPGWVDVPVPEPEEGEGDGE